MATVFQPNVFQHGGVFQIDEAVQADSIGARITGGTFARHRWHEITEGRRRKLEALEQARKAREERQRELARKAREEKRAARTAARLAEDQANAEAAIQRMLAEAMRVSSAAHGLSGTMTDALAMKAMGREAARKAQQDDEDEAISLLLLS